MKRQRSQKRHKFQKRLLKGVAKDSEIPYFSIERKPFRGKDNPSPAEVKYGASAQVETNSKVKTNNPASNELNFTNTVSLYPPPMH